MKPSKADSEPRLLSYWEPPDGAGHAVGCVATTYTFDGAFFEEHCLGRFARIDSNPGEDSRSYLIEREEKLAQLFSCVLVDRAHVARSRSLRWHLLPVTPGGGGIQHAKVSLLVWQNWIRVLVASANLTEPGYRRNLEQAAVLDFSATGALPLDLLRDVLDFLDGLQEFLPQAPRDGENPRASLSGFLSRARQRSDEWPNVKWPRGAPRAAFVPVRPGAPTFFDVLRDRAWRGTGADKAYVLSPFYDSGTAGRLVLDALVGVMGKHGKRTISFYASGRRFPDGRIELDLPEDLRSPHGTRRTHRFHLVTGQDASGALRDLHAKSIWLERDRVAVMTVGSSNFTIAGTGVGKHKVNIEANVAYMIPNTRHAFGRHCASAWPQAEEVTIDQAHLALEPEEETPEPEAFDRLHEAFGLAIFTPEGDGGRLELVIARSAPSEFVVEDDAGNGLLDASQWIRSGRPRTATCAWKVARPPSSLVVRWAVEDEQHQALWVVNVSDASRLPPPSELRDLTLEELLEVLTSARPLHEVVAAVLRRRERRIALGDDMVAIDPHRKVDARNFLLRRVRRVSQALEGMRERLERPAFTRDAMLWRLHGPLGVLTLARRLAEQERQGASFMIAEVALTLKHADLRAHEELLGASFARNQVEQVIGQLEALAAQHPSPDNLAAYVHECFAEAAK